jgi:hypothetical protein
MANDKDLQDRNYKRLAWTVVAVGFLISFSYGYSVGSHSFRCGLASMLIAAAPLALGGLAGFLFGIPKTLQANEIGKDDGSGRRHGWQANTNLEQVSDWLTKILIGVGLTQLQKIPEQLQDTGDYVASSIGGNASPAIVSAMLVIFLIAGFVIAYLLTMFDLPCAIDAQDGLLDQLANAIVKNPNDRAAVESYMLSSLYMDPPESFDRTIQSGESFLSQEGHPKPDDGNVFAYLACAYGQKYAHLLANKATKEQLDAARQKVLSSVQAALERSPEWKPRLRQFANPPVGSNDDDLAALKDDPDLRQLLGIG